jgi:hypothetical protein
MLSIATEIEAPCAPAARCGFSFSIAEIADVLASGQQLLAMSR